MALNPFSRNSVSVALDDEDRRIAERAQGYMPGQTPAPAPRRSINPTPTSLDRQQAAPPRLPAESGLPSVQGGRAHEPTVPEPAAAPVNPRTAIEDLARQTRVPVNILMSIAEASGAASPEDALSAAGSAAARIAPLLAAGQTPEQAIAAVLGDTAPPETTGKILDRARQIGAEFYPDRMKPAQAPAPEDDPGTISTITGRTGKAVIGGGVGSIVRGAGEILAATADAVNAPINEASRLLTGKTIFDRTPAPFKDAADGIKAWADDYFGPMISENSRQAVADTQITGDPFKPSTWDWGKNPSFAGIAYQAIDVFGAMLPIVVAAYATGGLGAAALGGSQSAGDQAMSSDDALQSMFDEVQADGTRKIDTASRTYADLRAQGVSEQDALARTKAQGARLAAIIGAPIGALGGKLTASIIDPATNILAKSGFLKRVAGRAALGAAEEGIQEVAETVGGRVGTNLGAGTDLDLTKDTLGDLILGGLAGGAIGAGAGAMTRRQAPPPPPQGEPDPTLSLPPPPLVTPPPGGDLRLPPPPPMPPAAPRGPLTTALDAAPGALMSGVKPGTPLQLDLGNGAVMDATFVAENAMGVTIRELDGTTTNVPHEEIRSGAVAITQTPTPLMTIADLQALATTRLAELDAKESAGTKLSAPEQDQRSFLGNNLDNPEALADAFRVTLSEAAPVIPGATNDPAIIGATNDPSAALYDGRPVDQAGPLASPPRLPDPQTGAGNQAIPDGNNQPVPQGYAPLAQPQPGASVDSDASEQPADLTGPPAVPPASPQDSDAANTQLFLDMLNEDDGAGAGGAPQANPLGSPPPAVQNNPPPPEPLPKPQEVADEDLTPTERSQQHRDAITALSDGKLDVFKAMGRSPRLSAVNHLLTYDKVFAKTARGFLKDMGEERPSNAVLEDFIAKAEIGSTQQGPDLILPPTEDGALRAWAKVYLDEKAWNPFKGTFRQPSQAFRDWLASKKTSTPTPTEPAKPAETAQDPVQPAAPAPAPAGPADPAPAAAGPAAPTAPTSPTGIGPEDITARVKAGMPKVSRRTLTSGNDKRMTEVTVKDGPHAGISATGTNSPDALRELARTILQRERDGIGMTAPAPASAPVPFEPAALPPAPATENSDPAAATPDAAKPAPDAGLSAPASPRVPKLQDFGAFIGGQRKNAASKFVAGLGTAISPQGMTIADIFPLPDYEALAAIGASPKALAMVAILRSTLGRKPSSRSWSSQDWVEKAMFAREQARQLLDGASAPDPNDVLNNLTDKKNPATIRLSDTNVRDFMMFSLLRPDLVGEASSRFSILYNTVLEAGVWNPVYALGKSGGYTSGTAAKLDPDHVTSLGDASYAKLAALITTRLDAERARRDADKAAKPEDGASPVDTQKPEKPIELAVREYKRGGFAVFSMEPSPLPVSVVFDTNAAAKEYLDTNRAAIEAKVRRLRAGPNERRAENRERAGPVWRTTDATEEMYKNDLGFKGVAFGESTTAKERQARMNDTYDAMMDLAGLLGVPPKMLSLNGQLKLGFGTHGKGGKGHWAGVYMQSPGNPSVDQTIALTRKTGSGILAHEWWHAVDNFLARLDATKSNQSANLTSDKADRRHDFMSDRSRSFGVLTNDQYNAFYELRRALLGSDWKSRMTLFDQHKGKDYYATVIELAARGFERMVVDELYLRDMSNDFLANVDEGGGAYPSRTEFRRSGLSAAFDAAMTAITEVLEVKGQSGPKLPPVIEDRRYQAPTVGTTWESATGWKEITGYEASADRFTVTDKATGVEQKVYADGLAELMAEDAFGLTEDGQIAAAEKEAARTANVVAAEKEKARFEAGKPQRDAARAARQVSRDLEAEFVAAKKLGIRDKDRLAKQYRWKNGTHSVAHQVYLQVEAGALMTKPLYDNKPEYLATPNDGGYTTKTITQTGLDYARWLIARRAAAADVTAAQAALFEAMGEDRGFKVDNPGGDWLKEKRAAADAKMADARITNTASGRGLVGAVTGYFTNPIFLPTNMLAQLAGASGETREPGDPQYDALLADVQKNGFKEDQDGNAVLVGVNHKGDAFIIEGNTRVAVASALAVPSIRVEIRYFNGAETAKGALNPGKVYVASLPAGPGLVMAPRTAARQQADEDAANTQLFLDMLNEDTEDTAAPEPADVAPPTETVQDALPDPALAQDPDARAITDAFLAAFRAGQRFKTILQARKLAMDTVDRILTDADFLMIEEAIELAVVLRARELVAENRADYVAVYAELMDLYAAQPILGERTPDKMRFQAYSTPAPLAYVVSRLAGVGPGTRVLEPTAGNGMLAIEATPALVQANELQVSRASQLARSLPGATLTQSDALDMTWAPFDVLLTNPPFGKLTDQATQRRKSFSLGDTKTGEIDHAIAWDALRQMPEDGRAVLILGGIKKQLVGPDRLKAYQERSKTIFFKRLYDTYNVVDHFTVSGDLYNRQGAAWPVDVIVIDGRSQSQRDYPMKTAPEVLQSWVEVGRKLNDAPDVDTTERGAGAGNGDIRSTTPGPDLGQLPGQTGGQNRPDGGSGDTGRPEDAPNGQPSGGSGPSAGGSGGQPGLDAPAGKRGNVAGSGGRGKPAVASGPQNDVGKPQGDRPNSEDGPGRLPDPALPPVKPNPTAAAAASAAANIKGGAADILAGIRAALGSVNPNKLNSGPAFLEDMYAALKPYFIAGVKKFAVAGQDVVAMVRAMIKGLREIGMTTEEQAAIAPYAGRFVSDVQAGKIDPFAEETPSDEDSGPAKGETQFQITYKPRSKAAFVVGTFAPRAMLDAMNRALDKIEAEHGQIDAYVAKELGYTLKELIGDQDGPGFFSAEQIDALAMAISNVSEGKGFIIGDQTGVGKGRFVAAMLRYGARKGRIPVFVSQKPGLYADMVRDLRDIGMADVQSKIIATNAGKPPVPISGDDDLFVMPTKKEVADLAAALYQGKLPDGKEYLFTTYDQMKTVGGKWPTRSLALMSARAKIMLVLDESHTAGGSASGVSADGPRALGQEPRNSAEFFRDLVADAAGTVFSSATYAKSPSVMSLYASTNLSLAVQDINTLGATIEKGGVPAQQIIANQLTADGQYVRREKSFDGIEFGGVEMATNPEFAVKISEAIATLADFDVNTMQAIRDGAGSLAAQSGFTMIKNQSVGVQGASSNTFASVVHNLAAQFLLAVKTEAAADLAIQAWKNGEKPILTLMNVNTSIVDEAVEDLGLKVGDTMDVPFALIIERYLERLRYISLTLANDEKIRIRLTDAEIGPFAVAEFAKLRKMIMDLPLEGLSGSPVDALRNKLTAAGMKVDEITGRNRVITNGVIGLRKNDAADNKRRMNGYNGGALDALILSSSGSTGFSMHATGKKGNDGKPRHMIVLQSHADINVFMQTLGRINRTGQIVLPKYSLAFSDLAIEKRAAAVLMAKMASLNANTTAGKRSATTLDVVDFINEVGDEVIKNYLVADDYLAVRLGIAVDPTKAAPEGLAGKVTGRFIFLPPDEVTTHYEAIELLYKDRLYQLEQEGRSPLEAKTIDLQAIPVSRTIITKGRGTGSELDQDTVLEVVSARVQGSPYSPDTVRSLVAAALDGKSASAWLGDIQTALGALMPAHMARMQETHTVRVEAEKVARAAVEAAQDQTFAARTAFDQAKPRDFGYYGSGVQKARQGDRVKLADGSEGVIEREAYWRRPEGSPPGVQSGNRIFVKTDAGAEVPTRLTDLTLITASPAPVKTAAELQALAQLESAAQLNEARLRKVMTDAVVGMDQSQGRMNDEREKLRNTVIGIGGVTPGKVFTMKHTSPSGVATEIHAVAIAVDISKVGNNPTAQSRIRVRFALADPQREIGIPLSQLMNQSGALEFDENSSEPFGPFKGQSGDRREDRMIVTGNLLGGIESFRTSGQVVFYTTDKGATQPGLLMPKGFDPAAELASNDVTFKTPALAAQFVRENAAVLKNGDKIVSIVQDGSNFKMTIRKQGGRGTPYFQLVAIQPFLVAPREAKGDYTARIMRADLPKMLEGYTANLGTKWIADSFRDEARTLNGESIAGVPAALPAARPRRPTAPEEAAQPPRPTNADFRAMTADLNAELRRAGLALRVKVALTHGLFIEKQPVDGFFTVDPATRSATIAVDMNGTASAIGTMRHEIVHALRSSHLFDGDYGLFSETEWSTLVAAARRNRAMMAKAQADYSEFTPSEQIEEVIAEQYRLWADGRDTVAPVAILFQRIKDVAEAVLNFLAGRGFTAAGGIFRAIAAGQIGNRQFDRDTAGRFARADVPAPALNLVATRLGEIRPGPPARLQKAGSARTPDGRIIVTDAEEKTLIEQAVTQAMSTGRLLTLGMVPGRPLFKELGRKLKSAVSYLRFKEEMDALRDEWHAKADDVAQGWRKITSKNGEANARLMDIMHDATLTQIDPTRPFQRRATKYHQQAVRQLPPDNPLAIAAQAMIDKDMKRKAAHDDMVRRYRALPADFQAMFVKVRDQYTDLADAFDEAILANIQKAMDINIRKAQRAHADELRRINDEGLVGGERMQAVADADGKLQSARDRLGWGAKARMLKLRAQFESNRLEGPYFPLSRFGEFFATVRDANGVVTNFSRFESVRERDRFATAERKKPDQSIEVGVISDVNLRSMVDPSFVAEIENLLGGVGMPPQVLDEIWQKWLATLPEMSERKNRIHRKGTAGFDRDAFRSFGKHLFHGAHQLARLTFTLEMGDALEEARREAARLPDATRQGMIVKEMEARHEYTLNPTGAWWSQALTTAAFVWYLAVSPAAALVNLTQTTIVGIPVMSTLNPGKGGMGQAAKQLNRALLDFTRGKGHATNSDRLTSDEKAAMAEAYRRGTIERTQSHDLASVSESGTEYSPVRTKVVAGISFFFHHTERMNREITFLASYRMAKANGAAPADAVEKAADITWRTHFDYANSSRPRIMQGDVARVALVFKNFQVNLLWRLFRDTHQLFNGETPEIRREAKKQILGITGMMMMHAGVSGTWLFGLTMSLVGLFMPGDDDPEEEVKRIIIETLGEDVGGALFYGLPGHLTGINLTDRIGMPDLWFRSSDRAMEGEDAYNYWLQQLVGAVPSIGAGMFRGAANIADGEYLRGAEQMVPKAARDLIKTYRYATEGVLTTKGDPLVEELTPYQTITQALGFTPAIIAERYAANSRLYERQGQILDDHSSVLREAATLVLEGKPLTQSALDAINAFNAANPDYPISADTIRRSVQTRQTARSRAEFGAILNPKLNDRLRAERAPLVYGDP